MLAKNNQDLMNRIKKQIGNREEVFAFVKDDIRYSFYYSNQNTVFVKKKSLQTNEDKPNVLTVDYSELSFSDWISEYGRYFNDHENVTIDVEFDEKYSLKDKVQKDMQISNDIMKMSNMFADALNNVKPNLLDYFREHINLSGTEAEVWIKMPDNVQNNFFRIIEDERNENNELYAYIWYMADKDECTLEFRQGVEDSDFNKAILESLNETYKTSYLLDSFMKVHNEKIVERIKDYFENEDVLNNLKLDCIQDKGFGTYIYVKIPMDVMHYPKFSSLEDGIYYENEQAYIRFDLTDYDGVYRTISTLNEVLKQFDLKPLHNTFDKMETKVLEKYYDYLTRQQDRADEFLDRKKSENKEVEVEEDEIDR